MSEYIIQKETLDGIADAIRDMRKEKGAMTPAQMVTKIKTSRLGHPIEVISESHINPQTGRWERPAEYPDLGSLTIGDDFDGLYLTYDLSKIDTPWIGVFVTLTSSGSNYKIERGHITNGEFVTDETWTASHNTYFRQSLDSSNGNYQVFRITSADSSKYIARFGFCSSEASDTSTCLMNNYQPCIERVGRMNYVQSFDSSPTSRTSVSYATIWLEHDHVESSGLRKCSTLNSAWRYAMSLQEVYVDWNTTNWEIQSLYGLFSNCSMLENIIGIENWDTTNWTMTYNYSMQATFEKCSKLKYLPIGGWNTSNWGVKNLQSAFAYCYSLQELDLSGWDVSNWRPTSLYLMFMYCTSLVKLDVSTWDVSDWSPTSIQYLFAYCTSLQNLDVSNWDVSNWRPTSMSQLFSYCQCIKELDLSKWDVSDWSITTSGMDGMFSFCMSLQHLDISTWDVSNWTLTSFTSVFNNCYSLQEIDLSNWDVSGWALTSISSLFAYCQSLKEIDLSNWDCSNWALTSFSSIFGYCYNIDIIKLPTSMNLSGITSSVSDIFRNVFCLRSINRLPLKKTFSITDMMKLSPASIRNILNSLPTVTSATTITLGTNNIHKVTAADIAVATQKGWTVA